MSNLIIPSNPNCPLCGKKMKILQTMNKRTGTVERFFNCFDAECMVSINALDPAVNNWKLKNAPKCTVCGADMKIFFRTFDKYMKAQCPKCRKKGKLVQVVREPVAHNDPRWSA
jgi:predicted RNA-binding Zn-ribbon protein involved in translation (DUF1610 family)